MEYMQGAGVISLPGETAVTLGKFDGLHRGHQKLINRIVQKKREGLSSVVFALRGRNTGGLLLPEERRRLLENRGVSCLIDCPMTEELIRMDPEDFVAQVLADRLHARYIAVGSDFRFGYQRRGDIRLLGELGRVYGYRLEVVKKEQYQGQDISSSLIRQALEEGRMEQVNALLGYAFSVSGEVLHGRRIGHTLGMPTTNLVPSTRKLLPPNGVYLSVTVIGKKSFPGITNIGYKPTIGERFKGVETHIFDFDEDLYGRDIEVKLLRYRRPERKFSSREELKAQMENDIAFGREFFHESGING